MKFIRYAFFGIIIAAFIAVYLMQDLPDKKLHIYFLDIGQGDSILLRSPDNRYILIDGGPTRRAAKLISEITGNLKRKIDLVILSHPHADHYAGLIDVAEKYEIGMLILPNSSVIEPLYNSFLNEISKRKIKTIFMPKNLDINFGAGVYIDNIFSPRSVSEDANEASLMFRILYGKLSVFMTGDAPKKEEFEALKTDADMRADILKVGHHGSKTSTSEEFLNEVSPSIAVIQSGAKNKYGHPHQEIIARISDRGIKIFRNDAEGTIEFVSSGK